MTRYLLRRTGLALGVLWAAFTASFVVLYLIPGDAVEAMVSAQDVPPSAAELARLRATYGVDEPLIVQYGERLWAALHGDFGDSIQTGRSVTSSILDALPSTALLAGTALVLAIVGGGSLAVVATGTESRWARQVLLALPPLAVSLPTFWVGLVLIQVFSFQLGLFPSIGGTGLSGLVLPAVTLALPIGAVIAQILAKSLTSALDEPYVTTARAKGVGRTGIHLRHALRNAALPALTAIGLLVGQLLAGSVVVETVFARVGVGRLTVQGVTAQDIPLVQGIVVFGALVFVTANLLVDLVYPVLDPRIVSTPPISRRKVRT
ncbi:ABC transporter permease [Cumulibacter manganitolerans]|uniref:ABC transporter permease n=1 Tax=Cumulibacter manganitolerans TaxID=1884992 RepID=UPI001296FEBE|nr:ABC transporter permease [Cumulibacter manganitolerans]